MAGGASADNIANCVFIECLFCGLVVMASVRNVELMGGNRNYDNETQKVLEEIDIYQNQIDAVRDEFDKKIIEFEKKHTKRRQAYLEKRNAAISKIPNFWVTAFMNHPDLSTLIDDVEEDCLHNLSKLEVEEQEDIISGYRIHFHFDENPYFENSVLTKDFHLGNTAADYSQSTPIKWKEGFDLTQNSENKSKGGRKRQFEQKSFFSWFTDNVDPYSDDIAELIRDDLWLNPLHYYLVPDIEVDNGADEDASDEDVEVDIAFEDANETK